jgi:formylglycine-generating enzyme required for sulfatase activity
VSWDKVQGCLRKLQLSLPGCVAALPTEAEWEYACRAGTDTTFSFGANVTPEAVNYDGTYPYAGGEKGLYRKETVPVKSLPPNAWGLYEMHGNVWEWCAEGMRRYDGQAQQDPEGPVLEGSRVVRGGSWFRGAGRARSACRIAHHPGIAFGDPGFRLCLRSIEAGPALGRPGGPAGLAPGGPPTPPPPEAGAARVKRAAADWLRPDRKR